MVSAVQEEEMVDTLTREVTFLLGQDIGLASELPGSQGGEGKHNSFHKAS